MNPKTLMVMASCGAVLTVLALSLDSGRNSRATWRRTQKPFFPNLPEQVQDAGALVIESSHGVTTLRRSGDDWQVVERNNYPGRGDEVGRLLVALAEARRVEPLTIKPKPHESLGLGGFEDEESPTVRLTARAADGSVLADLYIGNRRAHGVGEGWYVREPGNNQVWAAQGKLRCPRKTGEWLQTELLDISRDRIASVLLEHADGERIELTRQGEDGTAFEITNMPEGREPESERSAASFLGSLANLRLSDVQPAEGSSFPEQADTVTTWWTRGGLRVRAELAEVEDELLCRFDAAFDPEHAPGPEAGPALAPEEGSETDEPAAPPSAEELQAEAAALNKATAGWVFVLPSWKKNSLVITMEELLVPLEEIEEEAAPEGPVVPAPGVIPVIPPVGDGELEEEQAAEEEVVEETLLEDEEVEQTGDGGQDADNSDGR